MMKIEYKTDDKGPVWREVTPVSFHKAGKSFYMIAVHQDIPIFLLLEHIGNVKFTNRKTDAKRIPSPFDLFRNTLDTFTGGEKVNIRLLFDDKYYIYLSVRFWVENQQVVIMEEGVELRLKIKLSYEFCSWLMGWGKNVNILEPEALKQIVLVV